MAIYGDRFASTPTSQARCKSDSTASTSGTWRTSALALSSSASASQYMPSFRDTVRGRHVLLLIFLFERHLWSGWSCQCGGVKLMLGGSQAHQAINLTHSPLRPCQQFVCYRRAALRGCLQLGLGNLRL